MQWPSNTTSSSNVTPKVFSSRPFPNWRVVHTQASSLDEPMVRIQEAIRLCLEANRDRCGDPPMDQKPSTPIPLFASPTNAVVEGAPEQPLEFVGVQRVTVAAHEPNAQVRLVKIWLRLWSAPDRVEPTNHLPSLGSPGTPHFFVKVQFALSAKHAQSEYGSRLSSFACMAVGLDPLASPLADANRADFQRNKKSKF